MKLFASFASVTTRFPVSSKRASGACAVVDMLADQIVALVELRRRRRPGWMTTSLPDRSMSGLSRLATQTTVFSSILLYHMPI